MLLLPSLTPSALGSILRLCPFLDNLGPSALPSHMCNIFSFHPSLSDSECEYLQTRPLRHPSTVRKNLHLPLAFSPLSSSPLLSLPLPIPFDLSSFSSSRDLIFGSALGTEVDGFFSIWASCSHSESRCMANLVILSMVGTVSTPNPCRARETRNCSSQFGSKTLRVIFSRPRTNKVGSGIVAPISVAR